jgi:chaperonin GroES
VKKLKKTKKAKVGDSGGRKSPSARGRKPAAPAAPARRTHDPLSGGRTMARVRPLRDRVMVRRLEEKEQKVGGIIVPDTAKEKPQQAEVMAVGSGKVLDNGTKVPLTVKAGDKVLVGKWSGTDVRIDGEDYLILKEDELLGILQ